MSEKLKERLFYGLLVFTTLFFPAVMFILLWETAGMSYTQGWAKIMYGSFFLVLLTGGLLIAFPPREEVNNGKK